MSGDFKNSQFKTFLLMLLSIFKFVTYPIRKPLVGVLLLVILFALPTFRGVPPKDVLSWYSKKLAPVTKRFVDYGNSWARHTKPVRDTLGEAVGAVGDMAQQVRNGANMSNAKTSSLIEQNQKKQLKDMEDSLRKTGNHDFANIARGMRGEETPYKTKPKISYPKYDKKLSPTQRRIEQNKKRFAALQKRRMPRAKKYVPKQTTTQKPVPALEKPVEELISTENNKPDLALNAGSVISGKPVFNRDVSLTFGEKTLSLYGIEVTQNEESLDFLKSITGNDEVECVIKSSDSSSLAAICSAGGLEFNQMLVDAGFANPK